jgi:hypothetical protein
MTGAELRAGLQNVLACWYRRRQRIAELRRAIHVADAAGPAGARQAAALRELLFDEIDGPIE